MGVGIILVAVAVWAFQVYLWLRYGNWLPLPTGTVLGIYPGTVNSVIVWRGVARIIVWLLEQPFSALALILGVIVTMAGFRVADNRRQRAFMLDDEEKWRDR